jgi:hypothetical protein
VSNYSTQVFGRFSTAFGTLANPHRLKIYTILSGCCIPDIIGTTDLSASCCESFGQPIEYCRIHVVSSPEDTDTGRPDLNAA